MIKLLKILFYFSLFGGARTQKKCDTKNLGNSDYCNKFWSDCYWLYGYCNNFWYINKTLTLH